MKQGFNVQFYCRNSKVQKNGLAPMEIAVNINGTRKFVQLPFKCLPSDFNKKRQPKEIQDYITGMRKRINEILADMVNSGETLTTQSLVNYIKNGGYKSYTVEDLFNDFLAINKKRIGTTLSQGVYEKYELVRDLFFSLIGKDTECTNITPAHVASFKATCESKYKTSTTGGYLQKLKTVLTFAQDNGKLKINPFMGTKITRGTPDITFLTFEELEALKNLRIENDSLRNVRDYFLFECYSGISYCDIAQLKVEDIQVTDDGTFFIKKNRKKTGKEFTSVLLPQVKDLLVIDNQGVIKNFRFKVITNQKSNTYLKVIKNLLIFNNNLSFLDKNLTTHIARHTYATLLANKFKCRMEVVASALGDSLKITQRHYAKFLSSTTLSEISSAIKKVG